MFPILQHSCQPKTSTFPILQNSCLQKTSLFLYLCLLNTAGENSRYFLPSGKFPSLQQSEHRQSSSLWNTYYTKGSRIPLVQPHFVALSAEATSCGICSLERTALYNHHAGANSSAKIPSPEIHPELKCIFLWQT
jgi:hypothetical protein